MRDKKILDKMVLTRLQKMIAQPNTTKPRAQYTNMTNQQCRRNRTKRIADRVELLVKDMPVGVKLESTTFNQLVGKVDGFDVDIWRLRQVFKERDDFKTKDGYFIKV